MVSKLLNVSLAILGFAIICFSADLQNPQPPTAKIIGTPGHTTICYWVIAESDQEAGLKDFPNKATDISFPCVVTNAPDKIDRNNRVELTIAPVAVIHLTDRI